MNDENIELAKNMMKMSYDPYTNFKVGAVLITKDGKKYTGCNVSNYGIISICAERVAFLKAISEGQKEFERIIVVTGKDENHLEKCTPCGHCRQFINEFADENFIIQTFDGTNSEEYTIADLLPHAFKI